MRPVLQSCVGSLLASLLLIACAPEDEGDIEMRGVLITGGNSGPGTVFNTHELDDHFLSELEPLGQPHVGAGLDSIRLKDDNEMVQLVEESGELVGVDWLGFKYRGAALLDSTWTIGYNMGLLEIPMSLLDVDDSTGVSYYRFYHQRNGVTTPNCPEGQDGPGHARVLTGLRVDEKSGEVSAAPGMLYLACDTGATGKAANLGYYDLAKRTGELNDFETAIRVLRADYCYDGDSHTKPGVQLLLEDVWGIHAPDEFATDPVEAVWGPEGLLCHGVARLEEIDCLSKRAVPKCSKDASFAKYPDGLFITRLPSHVDEDSTGRVAGD